MFLFINENTFKVLIYIFYTDFITIQFKTKLLLNNST